MKKKKIIPKFKSIAEEAKFWDTHSFADYWDQFEDVDIVVNLHKPKEETLVVRLQKNIKDQLKKLAKRKGVSLSTLARILLSESLKPVNR